MSTESQYYRYNPEKRNIFIEMHKGRTNYLKEIIVGFLMLFASQASAIVEVFLRRKFGERYITLAQSIGLFALIILTIPAIIYFQLTFQSSLAGFGLTFSKKLSFMIQSVDRFLALFMIVFLARSIYHRLEIKRYGTAYDFKRFSLSDGEIFPFWWKIIGQDFGFGKVTYYLVVVLLEPAIPILLGLFFTLIPFTRLTGILIFICGVLFLIRNFNKAQQGRDWVLDNIDKKISNEMKYDVFIGRKPKKDTKGIYLPIELPEDEETRQALYNMVEDSFSNGSEIWSNDYLDDASNGTGGRGGISDENDKGNGFTQEDGREGGG